MKGFLIGCGVVALLLIGGLVIGGLWIYNQAVPLVTQGISKLEAELKKVLPNLKGLQVGFNSSNGRNTLKLSAPVPFDPSQGAQAEKTAQQILGVVRQNLPKGIPATRLEVRLFRDLANGAKQERTFGFDLTP